MKILHIQNEAEALERISDLIVMARKERVPVKRTKSAVEFWLAESNGKIVGFQGATILNPTTARLKTTFVHPNYRGNGIFDKLFAECLKNLEGRGIIMFTGFFTPMSLSTGLRYGFKARSMRTDSNIVFAIKQI